MALYDNVKRLRESIAEACAASGRKPDEISIVAATKCVSAEIVRTLPELGITAAGENRVQEFRDKYDPTLPLEWHVIGALQTNKVKYVVGKVAMIQSVDRLELVREINRLSERAETITDVLIEVNIGGEQSKSGTDPSALFDLAESLRDYGSIRLRGLMCIPPKGADDSVYMRMRELYGKLGSKYRGIDTLSMGMSDDYVRAIKCGSTMIRPGRVLFGERI